MTLGEKLRAARIDAGMTQKQLSDGIVTRNMLSQIENGTATPSMKTLEALAQRLNKSISFLLEDAVSPNTRVMDHVRCAFENGDYSAAMAYLESYQKPDAVYDREEKLLEQLCLLELARAAICSGKLPYARSLLEKCGEEAVYCRDFIRREKLLLLAKLPGNPVSQSLPSIDEELLLRAREALGRGQPARAAALLDACEERSAPYWQLLRGKSFQAEKEYARARGFLQAAETVYPEEAIPLLEICFRELGDYQQAYQYACKQRR